MFQVVGAAADFAELIYRVTGMFPAEERYITVPLLRDHALVILENASLGMARFDISYRYIYITRAIMSLNDIHAHFIFCKTMALLDQGLFNELVTAENILRSRLNEALKLVDQTDPFAQDPF